jgi:Delta7-sterol 5-desaturase
MEIPKDLFSIFKYIFSANLIRYLIIAGLAFLVFYVILKNRTRRIKIQSKFPKVSDYQREILYSVLTFVIFSLVGVAIYNPSVLPYTQIYFKISDFGWPYFMFSIFLMILLHDTYFYWTHRLMHDPKLFKSFHFVHHQSTNPSPWASFAFQPTEAVVEAGIFVMISFIIPSHIYATVIFLLFMTTYNVYGHLGWELYPKNFNKHWLGKFMNTSTNHNMHHQYFKGNYGLYFTFWDDLMGTTNKNYHSRFDEVTGKK